MPPLLFISLMQVSLLESLLIQRLIILEDRNIRVPQKERPPLMDCIIPANHSIFFRENCFDLIEEIIKQNLSEFIKSQ